MSPCGGRWVELFEAGTASAAFVERRRHPRVNLYLPIAVKGIGAGAGTAGETACTVNVSDGGLYILTHREYPVGSPLEIAFGNARLRDRRAPVKECRFRARVVHRGGFIGPLEDGRREVLPGVGVAFEEGSWPALRASLGGG